MTKKKTKKRMADLEETGWLVPVEKSLDEAGYVLHSERTRGRFDLSLKDAPEDVASYKGLVIAKPARGTQRHSSRWCFELLGEDWRRARTHSLGVLE